MDKELNDAETVNAFHVMLVDRCTRRLKSIRRKLAHLKTRGVPRSWAFCSTLQATENMLSEVEKNLE